MQASKALIYENTIPVLSTDSDLFEFLKGMSPDGKIAPSRRSGDER